MISFEGKISKEVSSFARKKATKKLFPISFTFFLAGIIPFIVDYHFEVIKFSFVLSCELVAIFWLLFPILALKSVEPQKVEIEDEIIECYFRDGMAKMKDIDKVKRVTDRGNFYEIDFYFPPGMVTCVCQKDLLVAGTIEEFEDCFRDKLVRKLK